MNRKVVFLYSFFSEWCPKKQYTNIQKKFAQIWLNQKIYYFFRYISLLHISDQHLSIKNHTNEVQIVKKVDELEFLLRTVFKTVLAKIIINK